MCLLLPDTLCGLFQVFSLWAWWENRDKTMATMRQEHQSRVSSPFVSGELGRKLWKTSEGFSRCCSVGLSFQESLDFLHNSWSTQPAVVSFSIQSFHFFCLGCNPVIGLSLWSSVTFLWFDLRKSKCWRMLLFKCKIEHLTLPCGDHRPNWMLSPVKYACQTQFHPGPHQHYSCPQRDSCCYIHYTLYTGLCIWLTLILVIF